MEKRIGLRYTTLLINFHRQENGENAVGRPTVNLAFRRLQPKTTKVQKIQQGIKNEGKWKEARSTVLFCFIISRVLHPLL